MNINFNIIEEKELVNFKGGEKSVFMKAFSDEHNKVAMLRFPAGASIGLHRHEGTSETIYVLEGNGEMLEDDGSIVPLKPGDCSYCPEGCQHSLRNPGENQLIVFAVIPSHGIL